MPVRCEVELDIFSGMPNPTWTLTNGEADSYIRQIAKLPRTSKRELSGNLGYRGFIVQCTEGVFTESARIQNGTVLISNDATNVFAYDENRELERWLLITGKPYLNEEIFQIAEREVGD